MKKSSPTIAAIKDETRKTLAPYFQELSNEFGIDLSHRAEEIAIFLAANAHHETGDLVKAFSVPEETLAEKYMQAKQSILDDSKLALHVMGSARVLGIAPEDLDMN